MALARAARAEPCSICDNDLSTTKLCGPCRRDPANADWCEGGDEIHADPDHFPAAGLRHADLIDRPLREPTQKQVQILELLALRSIRAPVRVRRRQGGLRVWVWGRRSRPLRFEEVAWLVGTTTSYVHRVYKAVLE